MFFRSNELKFASTRNVRIFIIQSQFQVNSFNQQLRNLNTNWIIKIAALTLMVNFFTFRAVIKIYFKTFWRRFALVNLKLRKFRSTCKDSALDLHSKRCTFLHTFVSVNKLITIFFSIDSVFGKRKNAAKKLANKEGKKLHKHLPRLQSEIFTYFLGRVRDRDAWNINYLGRCLSWVVEDFGKKN